MPGLVFVQTGVRSWTTEKDANNTLLRWGVFFFNSAQAPGDIMRRELDFFLLSFVNVPTYLHTLCKREIRGDNTKNIRTAYLPIVFFFSRYIQKMKISMCTVPYPRKNLFLFFFTKTSHTSILHWKVCPMSTCILVYCYYYYLRSSRMMRIVEDSRRFVAAVFAVAVFAVDTAVDTAAAAVVDTAAATVADTPVVFAAAAAGVADTAVAVVAVVANHSKN